MKTVKHVFRAFSKEKNWQSAKIHIFMFKSSLYGI